MSAGAAPIERVVEHQEARHALHRTQVGHHRGRSFGNAVAHHQLAAEQETVTALKQRVRELTQRVAEMLQEAITSLPSRKGENGAVLD